MDGELEQHVRVRAGNICQYCRMPQQYDDLPFQFDHIIAKTHGGKRILRNLALACVPDNKYKGTNLSGIDPATRKITHLFHPLRMKWARHFRWDGPVLVGRTPIGRTTVVVLHSNEDYRVQFRAQLIDEGLFPPP